MQEQYRTCQVVDHFQKAIEYVCTYSECKQSRFLCSKCVLGQSHKHNIQDNSHILDHIDFCKKMVSKLNSAKVKIKHRKDDVEKSIFSLKELIIEIQIFLKNIQNIILEEEKGRIQKINEMENQLQNIQKQGFNLIDEQLLNTFLIMKEQLNNLGIYYQLENYSSRIVENALKIKEWRLQQTDDIKNHACSQQSLLNIRFQIHEVSETCLTGIESAAISPDRNFLISGGEDHLLKIWDYQTYKVVKSIQLEWNINVLKFTEDSTLLYAGLYNCLYQFDVKNQFNIIHKCQIESKAILNIFSITSTHILTSSSDGNIIKTDIKQNQQLLKISDRGCIFGLDYNHQLNIIASGSDDYSIKIWNANDGSLLLLKKNAHRNPVYQVLFITNSNQLITSCNNDIIIWNIDFNLKRLEQQKQISSFCYNISLVLQQQYILTVGKNFIKVYSRDGEIIREFFHDVNSMGGFNTVQLDSMKDVLIVGKYDLQICKFEED